MWLTMLYRCVELSEKRVEAGTVVEHKSAAAWMSLTISRQLHLNTVHTIHARSRTKHDVSLQGLSRVDFSGNLP